MCAIPVKTESSEGYVYAKKHYSKKKSEEERTVEEVDRQTNTSYGRVSTCSRKGVELDNKEKQKEDNE